MIAQSQIREKISRYLRNEISLDTLEDWLVQSSWNMHQDSDEEAQEFASWLEVRLAEHSSGHLGVSPLRDELRERINVFPPRIDFGVVPYQTIEFFQENKAMSGVLPIFMNEVPTLVGGPRYLQFPASVSVGT